MMTPKIGRIVHYTLSDQDAAEINRRRADFNREDPGHTGHMGHVGNDVAAGEQYPAMVVKTTAFGPEVVNLQVMLDGNDALWAPSRSEGTVPGTWAWPRITREG